MLNNKVYLRKIKLIFHYLLGIWKAAAAVSGKMEEGKKNAEKNKERRSVRIVCVYCEAIKVDVGDKEKIIFH